MSNVKALRVPEVEPYVTKRELAAHMHVSTKTVEAWVKAGMPHEKWGPRLVRFKKTAALQWVREHGRNAA